MTSSKLNRSGSFLLHSFRRSSSSSPRIAEVGRSPFDLIEADSELVAGFNIEYSGLKFGMFYVGDFMHAFTSAMVYAVIFLGGWQGPGAEQYPILGFFYFGIKTVVVHFITILIRGTLPRFRIDQMMNLNWKILTPIALVMVMIVAVLEKILTGAAEGTRVDRPLCCEPACPFCSRPRVRETD